MIKRQVLLCGGFGMVIRFWFAASVLSCCVMCQTPVPDAVGAEKLYRSGNFREAAESYKASLKAKPGDVNAEFGLIRADLRLDRPEEAFEVAERALAEHPDSAQLMALMGEVRFRRAEMGEAEKIWLAAYKLDHKEFHALLGLAKLYRAYSLYRRSYDLLNAAHTIAPDDVDVQREWFGQLPRRQRLNAMEAYLAGPHPDDEEESENLRHYIAYLKATVDQPTHACKLVSKLDETTTKLEVLRNGPGRIDAMGLNVQLNGKNVKLELDTGASGVIIGRRLAEQAGLIRISEMKIGGIGDKGAQTGSYEVAEHLKVGELEFHDCVVRVSDRKTPTDRDGLIGANVFASYLIDIDIPGRGSSFPHCQSDRKMLRLPRRSIARERVKRRRKRILREAAPRRRQGNSCCPRTDTCRRRWRSGAGFSTSDTFC
ncbi:MAG: hypothetical protein NVS9B15_18940 [Acidobacteriaceae bacterium]